MTKQKAAILAGVSFVITTGLMLFLCANAHIDFFPCKQTVRDRTGVDPWSNEAPLVTTEGTCSLMDHLRDDQMDPAEKSELTGTGWALLLAFCMGIGIADSALLYTVLSKQADKQAKRS